MPEAEAPIDPQTLPENLRYIAVEGVIGAGKTSLARMLAERYNGRLVLEKFEENPFLAAFYDDTQRWGFHTQLAFLASRFKQQKQLGARDLFHSLTVSDYTFDKDRIFAHLNLEGDEVQLYDTLYTLMETNAPTPDLVVYLQSSVDRLMQNISRRGREYEQDMDRSYIEALSEAYTHYFFHYTKSPLLIVNVTDIDFVNDERHQQELLRAVLAPPPSGTTYINPATSLEGLLKVPG